MEGVAFASVRHFVRVTTITNVSTLQRVPARDRDDLLFLARARPRRGDRTAYSGRLPVLWNYMAIKGSG